MQNYSQLKDNHRFRDVHAEKDRTTPLSDTSTSPFPSNSIESPTPLSIPQNFLFEQFQSIRKDMEKMVRTQEYQADFFKELLEILKTENRATMKRNAEIREELANLRREVGEIKENLVGIKEQQAFSTQLADSCCSSNSAILEELRAIRMEVGELKKAENVEKVEKKVEIEEKSIGKPKSTPEKKKKTKRRKAAEVQVKNSDKTKKIDKIKNLENWQPATLPDINGTWQLISSEHSATCFKFRKFEKKSDGILVRYQDNLPIRKAPIKNQYSMDEFLKFYLIKMRVDIGNGRLDVGNGKIFQKVL